jgi:hypothetical protein
MTEYGSVTRSMEIFALADELSVRLIENFIGRKLEFGSVSFTRTGEGDGGYRVYVNGTLWGENTDSIDAFLSGTYRFRVDQVNRGDEFTIFEEDVEILPDRNNDITFRTWRYGFLNIKQRGPRRDYRLVLNGRDWIIDPDRRQCLETGDYLLEVRQRETEEEEYGTVYMTAFSIAEGEITDHEFRTGDPGGRFLPDPRGTGEWQAVIDGVVYDPGTFPEGPVLAGPHTVEIRQIFSGGTVPVFRSTVRAHKADDVAIPFTLTGTEEEALAAAEELRSFQGPLESRDLSWEIQTMGGSWISAGVNYVFWDRRISTAALVGVSRTPRKDYVLTVSAKAHYIILEWKGFEPYAGIQGYFATDFGQSEDITAYFTDEPPIYEISIAPVLGVSWNTRWRIVSSVFFENGLFYAFGDDEFRLYYRIAAGVRLF